MGHAWARVETEPRAGNNPPKPVGGPLAVLYRSSRPLSRVAAALLAVVVPLAPAAAHETDQYSLPPGRRFVDRGDALTRRFYGALERAVASLNERIAAAERAGHAARAKRLRGPGAIARAVNGEFPWAMDVIEGLEHRLSARETRARHPGRLVGYKNMLDNIYQGAHFPLDPRQFFRIWLGSTFKAFGVYLGTDKIGHFVDMGMNYYRRYRRARRDGAGPAAATDRAVGMGRHGLVFSERGMLGYLSAGAYSNADMAANYLGLLFYRNLTEAVALEGKQRPPMTRLVEGRRRLADHVRPDGDFLGWFFSDHLNEALNPSLREPGMREAIWSAVRARRSRILWRYRGPNGGRRSPRHFNRRARELATYDGADYGHEGEMGELGTIGDLLFREPPPEGRNAAGHTPLHDAAARGDAAGAARALARGAAVDARIRSDEAYNAEWGGTALHLAARDGHGAIARRLLEAGAEPGARNERDATPLHRATRHPRIARLLLEHGARVDARDGAGRTPLHRACADPEGAAVATLLAAGAHPAARDRSGNTPLIRAARRGHAGAVRRLLDHGAAPGGVGELGRTPLHVATHAAAAEGLIEAGAPLQRRDGLGWHPLHAAAAAGRSAVAAVLLDHGADAAGRTPGGTTPLHLAARARSPATAAALLAADAPVEARRDRGLRPLHEAAGAGASHTVERLLRRGAAAGSLGGERVSPASLARREGHEALAARLERTARRQGP